ncbi:unnamed protein product [Dovyalis caffra]|uniref:Inositol polyphosphate-related phosphatase domain-containing protein n=1 Tax=Dovyalis caffra TaxID=77055 RepID=A0AAV1R2Q5_9ROSI|nr:unnamed protein product [Dovyalis caffra]
MQKLPYEEDESDYDVLARSLEIDTCILTNELSVHVMHVKIFVGTWNVAGRSPAGSLAVDVDEWLNLKDAADIYVQGFQENVPLKTKNAIEVEDPIEPTKWNLLIGKTLNDRYGCPWLTHMLNPISSENYHFVRIPSLGRRASFRGQSGFTRTEPSNTQHERGAYGDSKYMLMTSKKMVGVFISVDEEGIAHKVLHFKCQSFFRRLWHHGLIGE